MDRDLHPWGCYVVGKLPSEPEHPLVTVDKTHADRGLEGVFLGWHDTTPLCYIYCLKIQRILRVQDAVFEHDGYYPFLNPDCVITPGTLTGEQIVQMHLADEKEG
eukprot:2957873-Rhodomonas_salina.1